MEYPKFYDSIATLKLYDPLADILGALKGGIVEISYLDCVKFAGHSCPTVAGAYLVAQVAIDALCDPGELPQRSRIEVALRDSVHQGAAGVFGHLLGFIFGAAGSEGFKGIEGHFSRDNLLKFAAPLSSQVRITRLDTGKRVEIDYNPQAVPPSPEIKTLIPKILDATANAREKERFALLWQSRVERIFTDTSLRDKLILLHKESTWTSHTA